MQDVALRNKKTYKVINLSYKHTKKELRREGRMAGFLGVMRKQVVSEKVCVITSSSCFAL